MTSTAADLARTLLDEDFDALGEDERRVLADIVAGIPSSRSLFVDHAGHANFGDRLADRVAQVGGSWGFIITFSVVLFAWMFLNSGVLQHFGMVFDPYPYIFLNLMLSTLAAVQAPVIMMSQNRQAAKDRLAAKRDYQTNLRAELEILRLHEKVDHKITMRLETLESRVGQLCDMVEKQPKPD